MRHLDTVAVHAGSAPAGPGFRGTSPAIEPATAFVADSVERLYGVFEGAPGVVYSRLGNPTVMALEAALAELEGGAGAVAFGSGMAAIAAAWMAAAWMAAGARRDALVLTSGDVYGSTRTLRRQLFEALGAAGRDFDASAADAGAVIAQSRPAVVHVESVSNPLMKVADVPALASAAHGAGARLVVDATFSTPVLLRPLEHGADIVVHSLTKYLAGHGDVTGGICVTRDDELLARLRQHRTVTGAVLSPFDAWLTLRGLRTLALRMQRCCHNAQRVAEHLAAHPAVSRVRYPGLAGTPDHAVAGRLMGSRAGGMLAFELASGGRARALAVLSALRVIGTATTLGDVASLALHPASSSHRELSDRELEEVGIGAGLLRLSMGIEHPDDLVADLDQALEAAP